MKPTSIYDKEQKITSLATSRMSKNYDRPRLQSIKIEEWPTVLIVVSPLIYLPTMCFGWNAAVRTRL